MLYLLIRKLRVWGTKVHADTSKHKARKSASVCLNWRRNCEPRSRNSSRLREQIDQREVPDGLVVRDEIVRREDRLARRAEAQAVLEAAAQERAAVEQADDEIAMAQRPERDLSRITMRWLP